MNFIVNRLYGNVVLQINKTPFPQNLGRSKPFPERLNTFITVGYTQTPLAIYKPISSIALYSAITFGLLIDNLGCLFGIDGTFHYNTVEIYFPHIAGG